MCPVILHGTPSLTFRTDKHCKSIVTKFSGSNKVRNSERPKYRYREFTAIVAWSRHFFSLYPMKNLDIWDTHLKIISSPFPRVHKAARRQMIMSRYAGVPYEDSHVPRGAGRTASGLHISASVAKLSNKLLRFGKAKQRQLWLCRGADGRQCVPKQALPKLTRGVDLTLGKQRRASPGWRDLCTSRERKPVFISLRRQLK